MDPSETPVYPNPDGAPPNFINPPDLKTAQLTSGILLIVFAVLLVSCRLWTNYKLSRRLGLDDFLCTCALFLGIGYWALIRKECLLGFSRHGWDTPISTFSVTLIKINIASQIISGPAIWAAKSAILALYVRMFGKAPWLRHICHAWIIIMALFYSMNAIAAIVYTFPKPGQSWDESVYEGSLKMLWLLPVVGTFSVVADLVILVLPFRVLSRLHMNTSKKISLGLVFATGIVLVVLSVVGLYLRILIYRGTDPIWDGMRLSIVAAAEMFGTVMVSCAPALSAFWSRSSSSANVEQMLPAEKQSASTSYQDDSSTSVTKTAEYNVSEVGPSTSHVEESSQSRRRQNAVQKI